MRKWMALAAVTLAATGAAQAPRLANEHGRIPILEYHLVGGTESRWGRSASRFRKDLEILYARGYRPVTVAQLVDGAFDIPAGTTPVVITFDDASPGQFKYIEKDGKTAIDPESAVGIWLAFNREHPEWRNRATFCLLSGASDGHAFFGEKGIEGQKSAWRFEKLRTLASEGFELCAHTLWHADLSRQSDKGVQEQIARSVLAIDSAVTGYRVRTFALPLGKWPRNQSLADTGSWTEPRSGKAVRYDFDAVLEVAGPPVPSPATSEFNSHRLTRIQVFGNELEKLLDRLDAHNDRFVSSGAPTIPRAPQAARK